MPKLETTLISLLSKGEKECHFFPSSLTGKPSIFFFFFSGSKFDFARLPGIVKIVLLTWKFLSLGYKVCITGVDFSIAYNVSSVNSRLSLHP